MCVCTNLFESSNMALEIFSSNGLANLLTSSRYSLWEYSQMISHSILQAKGTPRNWTKVYPSEPGEEPRHSCKVRQ